MIIKDPTTAVNVLTKLADVIGKQTLVMWCIITSFTTGYLYIDKEKQNDARILEIKQSNERLVEEVKGIKRTTQETKQKVDTTVSKLDGTINNVNQTLKSLN